MMLDCLFKDNNSSISLYDTLKDLIDIKWNYYK